MGEEQEHIPSYVMLDKIDHEIFKAIQNRDVMDCVSDATNNIMEIVRDAMLSEQAVEAGGKSVHHHFGQGNWERVTRNEAVLARWRGEDNTRPATGQYVATANATLAAALDAMIGKENHDAD